MENIKIVIEGTNHILGSVDFYLGQYNCGFPAITHLWFRYYALIKDTYRRILDEEFKEMRFYCVWGAANPIIYIFNDEIDEKDEKWLKFFIRNFISIQEVSKQEVIEYCMLFLFPRKK